MKTSTPHRRSVAQRLLRALVAGIVAAITLLVLLVAIAWLLPDATRSAPAQALLDAPPAIDETGNGALLLEGLRAPAGSDSAAFGRARLAHAREHFARADAGPYQPPELPADALPLPDTQALCDPAHGACVERWLAQAAQIVALSDAHRAALDRLDTIVAQPRFQAQMLAHPDAPLTAYGPLAGLLRLRLAEATVAMENDDSARALDILAAQTGFLRRLLAAPDASLIQKMVGTSHLRVHLTVLGEWLHRWPDAVKDAAQLTPLLADASDAELDLRGAIRQEASWMAATMNALRSGQANAVFADDKSPSLLEQLLLPAFYKRDATLNDWATHTAALDAVLAGPHDARLAALQAQNRAFLQDAADYGDLSRALYNPAGRLLLTLATTDYGDYLLRLYDTQAVGRMVALQAALIRDGVGADDIAGRLVVGTPASPQRIGYDAKAHALTWAPLGSQGIVQKLEGSLYVAQLPR